MATLSYAFGAMALVLSAGFVAAAKFELALVTLAVGCLAVILGLQSKRTEQRRRVLRGSRAGQ